MENLIANLEIAIPMSHVIILLAISTVSVLFNRFKTALAANFVFIFYWVYENSKNSFQNMPGSLIPISSSYIIASTLFFGLALLIYYEIVERG
ncbi:MAG: hypothetical protein ACMUJM_01615 [bacterium]